MVTLSTLRRVLPYRWRLLSPTTAPSALDTVSQLRATWRQAYALMTVTQHGGTFSRALMAFATVIVRATVVRVASILVAVQPTWVGYSVGVRPRVLMSCCSGSGVKRECRALL